MAGRVRSRPVRSPRIFFVFRGFGIPREYGDQFLSAMRLDTERDNASDILSLRAYMHGSAGAVGVILGYLFGQREPVRLEALREFGEGMQMINFLRDYREDRELYGREYLKTDDFGCHIEFARRSLARADFGAATSPARVRFAIRYSRILYEEILNKIEILGRFPEKKIVLSTGEKLVLLLHACVRPE